MLTEILVLLRIEKVWLDVLLKRCWSSEVTPSVAVFEAYIEKVHTVVDTVLCFDGMKADGWMLGLHGKKFFWYITQK